MKNKICLLCALVILVSGLSGCEPLRKKFTRKKKETKQQEFIPVLQPVDYPDQYESPAEEYQYHYSLAKVWHKDVMTALDEDASDKRLMYILAQMIVHMEAMQQLLTGAMEEEMRGWVETAKSVVEQLQVPAPVRKQFQIETDLKVIGKAIREKFEYENVKDDIPDAPRAEP